MNDRIKNLCNHRADYWISQYDKSNPEHMKLFREDIEKFAKGIIYECSFAVQEVRDKGLNMDGRSLREQFGVD